MSPKSTSACSPSDTKCEKPMPRPRAQSSIAVTSAPDCDTKASVPGARDVREAGVQADVRRQQRPGSWAPGCAAGGAARRRAWPASARRQAGGHHDRPRACRARPARRSARHAGRRRADDRQLGRLRQVGDAGTLAGRVEAPITATEAGSNRESRLRTLMGGPVAE
jgi:hypothetical protein